MKANAGFTLIEVLMALAILAIALTAIIKATSQNIKDTVYLQNKTIAAMVGTQALNEARAGLIKLPTKEETEFLNRTWPWEGTQEDTPNPHIKKIAVTVFAPSTEKEIVHLESYFYVAQTA